MRTISSPGPPRSPIRPAGLGYGLAVPGPDADVQHLRAPACSSRRRSRSPDSRRQPRRRARHPGDLLAQRGPHVLLGHRDRHGSPPATDSVTLSNIHLDVGQHDSDRHGGPSDRRDLAGSRYPRHLRHDRQRGPRRRRRRPRSRRSSSASTIRRPERSPSPSPAAGFFVSGVGGNNTFALCLESGELFTRAPWAVVTVAGGTPRPPAPQRRRRRFPGQGHPLHRRRRGSRARCGPSSRLRRRARPRSRSAAPRMTPRRSRPVRTTGLA